MSGQDNGSGGPFEESPSGFWLIAPDGERYRKLGENLIEAPDGRLLRKTSDGSWEDVTEPIVKPLGDQVKQSLLQNLLALLQGKAASPVIAVLFGFMAGGGGGFAGWRLYGQDQDHEALATQAQVQALTEALSVTSLKVERLEAELGTHKQAESHPGGLARIHALEIDVAVCNELIRSHKQDSH